MATNPKRFGIMILGVGGSVADANLYDISNGVEGRKKLAEVRFCNYVGTTPIGVSTVDGAPIEAGIMYELQKVQQ